MRSSKSSAAALGLELRETRADGCREREEGEAALARLERVACDRGGARGARPRPAAASSTSGSALRAPALERLSLRPQDVDLGQSSVRSNARIGGEALGGSERLRASPPPRRAPRSFVEPWRQAATARLTSAACAGDQISRSRSRARQAGSDAERAATGRRAASRQEILPRAPHPASTVAGRAPPAHIAEIPDRDLLRRRATRRPTSPASRPASASARTEAARLRHQLARPAAPRAP